VATLKAITTDRESAESEMTEAKIKDMNSLPAYVATETTCAFCVHVATC
jgi:hypothetical protein